MSDQYFYSRASEKEVEAARHLTEDILDIIDIIFGEVKNQTSALAAAGFGFTVDQATEIINAEINKVNEVYGNRYFVEPQYLIDGGNVNCTLTYYRKTVVPGEKKKVSIDNPVVRKQMQEEFKERLEKIGVSEDYFFDKLFAPEEGVMENEGMDLDFSAAFPDMPALNSILAPMPDEEIKEAIVDTWPVTIAEPDTPLKVCTRYEPAYSATESIGDILAKIKEAAISNEYTFNTDPYIKDYCDSVFSLLSDGLHIPKECMNMTFDEESKQLHIEINV